MLSFLLVVSSCIGCRCVFRYAGFRMLVFESEYYYTTVLVQYVPYNSSCLASYTNASETACFALSVAAGRGLTYVVFVLALLGFRLFSVLLCINKLTCWRVFGVCCF